MQVQEKKIADFQEKILIWFQDNKRSFPWRSSSLNNYQIIISEILLQRAKAETVSKFYDKFIINYPEWESLATARLEDIEECLRPVGLYKQRAKRLQNLAFYMVDMEGILPSEREKLEEIPFMGQYIANAVELLIQQKNSPLLDVNMARVLERFFTPRKMADLRFDPFLQDLAFKVVNHQDSKEINWAILDFAASTCQARIPKCHACPLAVNCNFFNNISKN